MDFAIVVGSFLGDSRPFGHLCGMGSLQAWAVAEPVCDGFLADRFCCVCHLFAVWASKSAYCSLWREGMGVLFPFYFGCAHVLACCGYNKDVQVYTLHYGWDGSIVVLAILYPTVFHL